MESEILELEPKSLWKYFYELSQIPHPSKHEEKLIKYLINFAKEHNLECKTDKVGNVVIKKTAVKGFEGRKTVILQAHIDMVPQKNSHIEHNFETDPLTLYIEDGWVMAKDTTLGADNGIGVASMLAVLAATDLKHGNIEALFTVDEETGMTGAKELDEKILKGQIMLNLDTEDEGEIFIGCAGGLDVDIEKKVNIVKIPKNFTRYKISVTGLKGGHSGIDINLNRANAIILIFELLKILNDKFNIKISSLNCGSLRNAIPREAFVEIVSDANFENINSKIKAFEKETIKRYKESETNISIDAHPVLTSKNTCYDIDLDEFINKILSVQNGVIAFEEKFINEVKTSNNLAIIKSQNNSVIIKTLVRSSDDEEKYIVANRIKDIFKDEKVTFGGDYPGWKPDYNSEILNIAKNTYRKLFSKDAAIKVVHAGLECGILKKKMPNIDVISIGPTIKYPHSPDEKVLIVSVVKYWKFLIKILENIPNSTT